MELMELNKKLMIMVLLVFVFSAGCRSKVARPSGGSRVGPSAPAPAAAPSAAEAKGQGLATTKGEEEQERELIEHVLSEESFIESPLRRDPFRSFLIPLTEQKRFATGPQITSILDQYQLDELKLTAIVSGRGPRAGSPIAMLEDPNGVGHVIKRGNYVGKGEMVRRVRSGEEVQIYWRVARIREDAVVFEREDPFSPTEATVVKVMQLKGK